MAKVIGIIGSRRRGKLDDLELTRLAFEKIYTDGDTIVSGGCSKGGDRFAELIAEDRNVKIVVHKAEWDKYGKGAGFRRNTYIAKDADILIAVVASDRTGGTEDTIRKFTKLGKRDLILI